MDASPYSLAGRFKKPVCLFPYLSHRRLVIFFQGVYVLIVKSGKFRLPSKKALLDDAEIEIVLVDVTESPVERPKKNNENGIRGKRKNTP